MTPLEQTLLDCWLPYFDALTHLQEAVTRCARATRECAYHTEQCAVETKLAAWHVNEAIGVINDRQITLRRHTMDK